MKHFTNFLMFVFVCLVFFIGKFIGQNQLGIGVQPATGFSTTVAGCPTVSSGFFLCAVLPASGQPSLAMSVAGYNSGAPFALSSNNVTITGAIPIVVNNSGVVSCPTCAVNSAVVTGFGTPPRTGNVVLTKTDVLTTGIAATATTTASTTVGLQ